MKEDIGIVGIVGIGAMGWPMALHLHDLGHRVRVRDIRPAAEAAARNAGLDVHASPRSLASGCGLVALVVVDAVQIDAVCFGEDGIVHAAPRPGVVLLCSTIAPSDTRRIAERLAGHGIAALDAPISGGPARARDGSMSMMLAGPPEAIARWEPVLARMAARRFEAGPAIGDGAKAKLVNNLLAGINLVAGAEALALAAKVGLDPRRAFDIIRASSGASWVFEDRMARALDDDFEPRAATAILTKDMGLATTLAAGVGHPTPLGDAALARFRDAVDRGWAALDDAAVIKTYEEKVSTPSSTGPSRNTDTSRR